MTHLNNIKRWNWTCLRVDLKTNLFKPFDKLSYIQFHAWFTPTRYNDEDNENDPDFHKNKQLPENIDPEKVSVGNGEGDDLEYFDPIALKRSGLTKRLKPRIIRTCRFNINTHPDDYYREQVMLYTSWRHEEELLEFEGEQLSSYKEAFNKKKMEIRKLQQIYDKHSRVMC